MAIRNETILAEITSSPAGGGGGLLANDLVDLAKALVLVPIPHASDKLEEYLDRSGAPGPVWDGGLWHCPASPLRHILTESVLAAASVVVNTVKKDSSETFTFYAKHFQSKEAYGGFWSLFASSADAALAKQGSKVQEKKCAKWKTFPEKNFSILPG